MFWFLGFPLEDSVLQVYEASGTSTLLSPSFAIYWLLNKDNLLPPTGASTVMCQALYLSLMCEL